MGGAFIIVMCAAGKYSARSGVSGVAGRCMSRRVSARCGAVGTRSRAEPSSGVRRPCPVQRLGWPMRSGASGVARLDPPFVALYSGPFHYCASCERATPDAPETIDDQRRCTGCRYRTIYGGSHGARPYQLQGGSRLLSRASAGRAGEGVSEPSVRRAM